MTLRVIVIGAGLGGLALAQGLRRSGVEVAVFERDRTPSDRLQGYRVHINREGSRALHACLPSQLFDAFVATCGQPNTGIGMFTEQLRELVWFGSPADGRADPVDSFKSASRISLRQVLLSGLGDVVQFGKTFTHYEATGDQVSAYFADGSRATGDLLVGADGGNSRVRKQLLPHADRIDTGVVGIQAKTWLTDDVIALAPQRLWEGPMMIPGPGGRGMFLALHEFQPIPARFEELVGAEAATQRSYVMAGLLRRRALLPSDLEQRGPSQLRELLLAQISGWHPTLVRLVQASDLDTMLLTPIRTSTPVDPWPVSRVTLLGDAIHSMPPTGGIGANTALRDAALLAGNLGGAASGERAVADAIGDYETQMRDYGFAAVRSSLRNLRQQQRTENPLLLAGMKLMLRSVGLLRSAKRARGRTPTGTTAIARR
jgi:salicylate hydroxylase